MPNFVKRWSFWSVALGWLLYPVLAASYTPPVEPHRCVCPIDADGHCECVQCNLLGIHGEPRDVEAPQGDTLSGCTSDPRDAPAPSPSTARALCASEAGSVERAAIVRVGRSPSLLAHEDPLGPRIERPPPVSADPVGVAPITSA